MLANQVPAPDFRLPDHRAGSLGRDDLAGRWWVMWWFPRACSEVCSIQGRHLGAVAPRLQELGVSVVGVSFDEPALNARFAEQESLDFALLSDVEQEVGAMYDVRRPPDAPFADAPRRITYVIDPDGRVRAGYEVDDAVGHADVLVADVQRLLAESS